MGRAVFAACFWMLVVSVFAQPTLARGEYQTALDFYNQKQYAQAAPYFEAASLNAPSNSAANYYAGYCFYVSGRRSEAIKSLWRLVRSSPSAREASAARTLLRQIDPDYVKNEGGGSSPSASSAPGSAASGLKAPEKLLTTAQVLDKLIKVMPSTGKLANVSAPYIAKVRGMLETIPLPVLRFMLANGVAVILSPNVVEHDRRIQNTTPRGWNADYDWKASPALTHGEKVYMGQFRMDSKSGDYIDTSPEVGVVRHEIGHALDYVMGNFTEQDEFKHAYLLDAAKVPDELRTQLDYFLQKSDSGPQETFAELFCHLVGGETDSRQETCELVFKHFSTCAKIIQKKINSVQ